MGFRPLFDKSAGADLDARSAPGGRWSLSFPAVYNKLFDVGLC